MSMGTGEIFRSKPNDGIDLSIYGDYIPSAITYYKDYLYYSGFVTSSAGVSSGILVKAAKLFGGEPT